MTNSLYEGMCCVNWKVVLKKEGWNELNKYYDVGMEVDK
jgi:hypothetical protein